MLQKTFALDNARHTHKSEKHGALQRKRRQADWLRERQIDMFWNASSAESPLKIIALCARSNDGNGNA